MPANKPPGENLNSSTVDKFALFCAFVSVASVLGAHAIDRLADHGGLPSLPFFHGAARPGVDYTPTGAIKDMSRIKLDPCVATGENR